MKGNLKVGDPFESMDRTKDKALRYSFGRA